MKRSLIVLLLAVILPLALAPASVRAESEPGYYQIEDQGGYVDDGLLYPEELDDLLAPIALYPDPLIAQILPAATFVDQIHEAARFVRFYGNTSRIDYQPWDISVRAVAHYPQVLYMMDREYQWTASLGQAYIEQPQDVMDAIQRLRRYAWEQGNLYSTREQQVIWEGDIIRIVPARPLLIYVPVYDPYVVYVDRHYPSYPFITFSVGFSIGPWLNRDCNWRERRVYYHGWRGGGWIRRARPHIHDRRGIYINRRASVITINERVVQRDTRTYREQLRVESRRRRDEGRMPAPRVRTERPPRVEQPRPGKVEQPRTRIEQPRTRIEQPRPGSERRREPWPRRQVTPAPGVQAPGTTQPKAGTTPPPATQRQPAATQPRTPQALPLSEPVPTQTQPAKQQPQVQPGRQQLPVHPDRRQPQVQPGRQQLPVHPDRQQPQVQPGRQQTPAATGERPAVRPGKGERRREPRQGSRPGAQAPAAAPAAAPAPAGAPPAAATPAVPAPKARGAAPRAPSAQPPASVPAATPARPVTPRPAARPRVEPATPATPATPAPKAAEPAESARPARDAAPGEGRGRGGESSGGRAPRRGDDR